jgi:N-acetylmuramoyl-L-alanine amidase
MAFSVEKNRLLRDGKPVSFIKSPNHGGEIKPRFLIIHYTAGSKADGAINHFKNSSAEASAHLVIDRDGATTQRVDFNVKAWHAGKSEWKESNPAVVMLNGFSIGIEIVNAGKLDKTEDGKWLTWSKNSIPKTQVVVATHKNESKPHGWQVYTPEQIEVVIEIAAALHKVYKFEDILGHDDIAPDRKVDPGPLFPMLSFKSKILGRKD